MKQLHSLRTAILILAAPAAMHAQEFMNGSFEQNKNQCLINATTSEFNANVKNTHAFGSFRKPDIASSDCFFGSAKDGYWFVGLATNIEAGLRTEAITMQLTDPMLEGGQYALTFWTRSRSIATNLELGISQVDSSSGIIFYTVPASAIGAGWTEINVRFTAPAAGNYISVRAVNNTVNSGVWLDAFHLSAVFQPDITVVPAKPAAASKTNGVAKKQDVIIALFPNPSEGFFKVTADTSLVHSLTIYNMLGSQVEQHIATPEHPVPNHIDLTQQQAGLYFVEATTITGEKITKRIIVSR